jgi:hypothetical protein
MSAEQKCGNCAHWFQESPALATATRDLQAHPFIGACQRYLPAVVPDPRVTNTEVFVAVFPTTHQDRTCGEWEPRHAGGGDGEREPSQRESGEVVPLRSAA